MGEHERIYPRKPRKPEKSDETKKRERQRRAYTRIGKARVKRAVKMWKEWRELQITLHNRLQPSIDQFFPSIEERLKKDKNECDP